MTCEVTNTIVCGDFIAAFVQFDPPRTWEDSLADGGRAALSAVRDAAGDPRLSVRVSSFACALDGAEIQGVLYSAFRFPKPTA